MKRWILGLGGALLALAFWILGRDVRALRRTEAQRDELLATGANEHKKRAEKLNQKAERLKTQALKAAAQTESRLEDVGEKNPDMDNLLHHWESERVRQQSD